MLLHDYLIAACLKTPDKICVKDSADSITYQAFEEQANRIARYLVDSGLKKGDRVILHMDNAVNTCLSVYGVLTAGGVFVLVNPTTPIEKIDFIIQDCGARFIFAQDRIMKYPGFIAALSDRVKAFILDGRITDLPPYAVRLNEIMSSVSHDTLDNRIIPTDLAALIYTSGSTGNPKGVTMTHLSMVSAMNSIITYLQNVPDDIILNVLPLSFDYGLYQLLMNIGFGGTLVLEKGFAYPQEIIDRLKQEHITGFPVVPTICALLFKMTDLADVELPCLRYVTNTGAALPVEYIKTLRHFFPSAQIYSMYGLTECKRVSYLPPSQIDIRPKSVGIAMPDSEVYIVDDDGNEITEPGKAGELVVRGPNVMLGYWNRPEETAKMLRPGRHSLERALFTGDLFYKDDEGYLYFVARKDDIIKSRGEKVSPKEVENALYLLTDVAEAAVVGVKDDVLGQAVKAFVVLRAGSVLTQKDILAHCKSHLENYATPKFVEIRESLPRNNNGKIDKRQLPGSA